MLARHIVNVTVHVKPFNVLGLSVNDFLRIVLHNDKLRLYALSSGPVSVQRVREGHDHPVNIKNANYRDSVNGDILAPRHMFVIIIKCPQPT